MNDMPICYSYLRMSTSEQLDGDSLRRQVEMAEQYAIDHNLHLDTSLTLHDIGVSGFKSKNRDVGALSEFLALLDKGKIPVGSYLLVESFDRLSRDQVETALELFLSILRKGVLIVTLKDGRVYQHGHLNMTDLIISLVEMSRSHEESVTKSLRIKQAKATQAKRIKDGEILKHGKCPAWLRWDEDKFVPIPEHVEVIKRMFELSLAGLGGSKIASILNEEGIKSFSNKKWNCAPVTRLLQKTTVIGQLEIDGETVDDFYPAIISKDVFYKNLELLKARVKTGGRVAIQIPNAFKTISVCGHCGDNLHVRTYRYKGVHTRQLFCEGCGETGSIDYVKFEKAMLSALEEIDPDEILNRSIDSDRVRVVELKEKVKAIEVSIDNIVEAVAEGTAVSVFKKKLLTLEDSKTISEKELESLESKQAVSIKNDYLDVIKSLMVEKDVETAKNLRLKINNYLMKLVVTMRVEKRKKGYYVVVDYKNDVVRATLVTPDYEYVMTKIIG